MEYTLKFRSISEKLVCSCHLKFNTGRRPFWCTAVFLLEAGTVHLKSCHRKFSSETLFLAREKANFQAIHIVVNLYSFRKRESGR